MKTRTKRINRELGILHGFKKQKNESVLREVLKIHFGGQANLFDSGLRQEKAALASAKAGFPSLPEYKNLLLDAQKQLLDTLKLYEDRNSFKSL